MRYDLWNYPFRALTVKKLTLSFVFLSFGLLLYSAFTYVAYHISGLDVGRVWESQHFFPIPLWAKTFPEYIAERGGKVVFTTDWERFTFLGKAVWTSGVFLLVWAYFMAGIGVSRLELEFHRGDPFYPLTAAFRESLRKGGLLWTSALLLLAVSLLVLLVHSLVSLWGRITPLFYVSSALIILTYGFLVLLSLLLIYVLVGFAFVLIYGPAVSVAMEGDTFDLYYEGFSIFNEKLHRFILYEVWIYALKVISFSVFTFVLFRAVRLSAVFLEFLLPRFKFVYYPKLFLFNVPTLPKPVSLWLAYILPLDVYAPMTSPVPLKLSAIFSTVFGVWMLVFLVIALSYWCSLTWTGRLHTYARLLYEKDGIDVFKVKPMGDLKEVEGGDGG